MDSNLELVGKLEEHTIIIEVDKKYNYFYVTVNRGGSKLWNKKLDGNLSDEEIKMCVQGIEDTYKRYSNPVRVEYGKYFDRDIYDELNERLWELMQLHNASRKSMYEKILITQEQYDALLKSLKGE